MGVHRRWSEAKNGRCQWEASWFWMRTSSKMCCPLRYDVMGLWCCWPLMICLWSKGAVILFAVFTQGLSWHPKLQPVATITTRSFQIEHQILSTIPIRTLGAIFLANFWDFFCDAKMPIFYVGFLVAREAFQFLQEIWLRSVEFHSITLNIAMRTVGFSGVLWSDLGQWPTSLLPSTRIAGTSGTSKQLSLTAIMCIFCRGNDMFGLDRFFAICQPASCVWDYRSVVVEPCWVFSQSKIHPKTGRIKAFVDVMISIVFIMFSKFCCCFLDDLRWVVLGTCAMPTHGELEIVTGREYLQCRNLDHPDLGVMMRCWCIWPTNLMFFACWFMFLLLYFLRWYKVCI